MASVLETPAYKRVLADAARATRSSRTASGTTCRRSCGATIARELAYQPDDLPALAASLQFPMLVLVGEQDKPFVDRVAS